MRLLQALRRDRQRRRTLFRVRDVHAFTSTIKHETDLSNEDALDLAGELSGLVLSALFERLQLPGHEASLLKDLIQTMERREQSH